MIYQEIRGQDVTIQYLSPTIYMYAPKLGYKKKNTNPKLNKLEMWKIKSIIQIKIKYFLNLYTLYIYMP
jgi:hypothetical protein